ncbi:CusA/CzcA family heavy metal efflux RND transporter [Croceimicrobium sp.]|uniref:CusA/CzcA family heavy metal efflux RND transporter n=1 Tax=Croceimicrobium sp. TaxID=2828340 RepID=UPI003BADA9BB
MIQNIIRFSIKNKLIIGLLSIALVLGGLWSMSQVPLDAVPDITNNQVQVITQSPNLATEDMEQFVTYPVELAMANLPGVEEIRSVSRFGLSLVTIVFNDEMDTYLPRQLVAEKLNEVAEEIPAGFGKPTMGPISTGLGEIYQYTLEVDSAHRDQYSSKDLRSIQDWIIRRQMAMVPGVVEVNAFGGQIKQYEIAVDPDELRAMGLSIAELYSALQRNNTNTGGAYIEKNHKANFIRGEGLARSLEDLENILVENKGGIPIRIKDVAEVRYGQAVRYGAFTKDGQGEAVGGMILMLKGANSNKVIQAVKDRVEQIQKSLPEGLRIEPFLDRSSLIAQTTGTISRNLLEGALIVIFVLVLLLGNFRGGLIVASTIPLSLLFAFVMMNIFGVWANLMSLGAIDFGIIVDGAVIIVEGTVFLLHDKLLKGKLSPEERDEVAIRASGKMMNSAFFGQLIILIVFIPILALQGVEGKMFQPMALTFIFAMIGVMILCLTYVPMMSAWLLRRPKTEAPNFGDRLILKLEALYESALARALKSGKGILISAIVLLGLAIFSFSRIGGEFIPQLDEGDIAFHAILKPGSSLQESIATSTKIESLLLNNFPEVKHVMSRFGVADVPTDPMPMDVGDCFVLLKPKSEWVSANSKGELIAKMKAVLSEITGVNFEFTQPIEMRFNELLTGVREDIAVKLFGEDLDILAQKAEEMGQIIATVPGVADMKVEATKGLPQMTVQYHRAKLAQYGLHIDELNQLIQSAFAGAKAGVIFEGERRFDLMIRLDAQHRESIDDLKNLYITLSGGTQIPIKEVADISYQSGPMQISRDNTQRRTYVGINVRGRDIQSLVQEIQEKLDAELELPSGYYLRYGGAFENLERASQRLKVVVPLALVLIFLLIFFALKSLKQSLMIFIAIPLAAIGGVFSLALRGMPFSISAGVGFIVLFGVAVLNGLVLISAWNELKAEGDLGLEDRIRLGAKRRIRPIMLTALTDVLGFLPMAISSSAGAEVQQPLATVVIGGMISASLLSLFILPILYRWFESRSRIKIPQGKLALLLVLISAMGPSALMAQESSTTVQSLDEAIKIALKNNEGLKASELRVAEKEEAEHKALSIPKTQLAMQYGQYNSAETDLALNVNQTFAFPTIYARQYKLAKAESALSERAWLRDQIQLKAEIRSRWYQLSYLKEEEKLLLYQDSIYSRVVQAAELRYQTGESRYLEKASAETQLMEVQNQLRNQRADIAIIENQLRFLLNNGTETLFAPSALEERELILQPEEEALKANPELQLQNQKLAQIEAEQSLSQAQWLPEFSIGYFNQSMIGTPTSGGVMAGGTDRFTGIQAGLSIPLFFGSYRSTAQAARLKTESAQSENRYFQSRIQSEYAQQMEGIRKYQNSLQYYRQKGLPQADLILEQGQKSYRNGAIGYLEYFQSLKQALDLKMNFLQTLNDYNQALIQLEYLMGR